MFINEEESILARIHEIHFHFLRHNIMITVKYYHLKKIHFYRKKYVKIYKGMIILCSSQECFKFSSLFFIFKIYFECFL